jgi:hypothetical protein
MNKPEFPLRTPTLALVGPSSTDPGFQRMIVLIREELDHTAVRKVWELAHASGGQVELLSLCKDAAETPGLRRRLVPMVSLLNDGNVSAILNIETGADWVEAVRRHAQPCDVIVCFAEQRSGLFDRPLSQLLLSRLDNPVYILPGLSYHDSSDSSWFLQVLAWAGAIAILAGAFLLQVQIVSLFENGVETTLLALSILAEAWLIGVLNSLFG